MFYPNVQIASCVELQVNRVSTTDIEFADEECVLLEFLPIDGEVAVPSFRENTAEGTEDACKSKPNEHQIKKRHRVHSGHDEGNQKHISSRHKDWGDKKEKDKKEKKTKKYKV